MQLEYGRTRHRPTPTHVSVQANVSKLLSKEMQELMLQQSVYIELCAGLAAYLETPDDTNLGAALEKVDGAWAALLASLDDIKGGLGLFMLFTSMHAPPRHWPWYLLGGIRVSLVVRPRGHAYLWWAA